jgi:hypothetical protein
VLDGALRFIVVALVHTLLELEPIPPVLPAFKLIVEAVRVPTPVLSVMLPEPSAERVMVPEVAEILACKSIEPLLPLFEVREKVLEVPAEEAPVKVMLPLF